MNGVGWAGAIWATVLLAVWIRDRNRPAGQRTITRETVAMVLALLGTHSIVAGTDAEEILRDPVAAERILRGSLAGLAILIVAPRLIHRLRTNRVHGHRGLLALTVYLGIASISTAYSAVPLVTGAKAIELGAGLAAIGSVALSIDGRERLKRTANLVVALEASLLTVAVAGFFAVPSIFSFLYPRPGFISELTMVSPYTHSNGLASTGALAGAYALARFLQGRGVDQRRYRWLALAGIGLLGTILSSGRQGVAIWLLSVLVLLLLLRPRLLVLAVVPATIWVIASFGDAIWQALLRNRPATLGTLTGRTVWWGAAIDAWRDHPWTGWGYGVGGRFVALESIGRATTSNLHSGYFEALAGLGILGIVPLIYSAVRTCVWSAKSLLRRVDVHLAILMVPLVLRTGVAQGFGAWLNFELVLFTCLVAIADWDWIGNRNGSAMPTPEPMAATIETVSSRG
jgi:O-antigen ligase